MSESEPKSPGSGSNGAQTDGETEKSNQLEPDAVFQDGLLAVLSKDSGPQRRSVSFGSRNQLEAHQQQMRYHQNRNALNNWLAHTVKLLNELLAFAKSADVYYPESGKFKVFALDLKMGASSVGSSIFDRSMSSYVEAQVSRVTKHTISLQKRIQDTTSRVLVTGDLNAGKSSLCNALLRRPVLPVDQQPCTEVFCEVNDLSRNDGVEEVHAVFTSKQYDRNDLTSYEVFPLIALPDLVRQEKKYSVLKVYMKDNRPQGESLLENGVIDICLVDAPGLNVDVNLTEELFGAQEEIDLVIFVVSAENHFTQSSKEFVSHVAKEKSLVFIVANNYDKIKDADRCVSRIMSQVADLTPETHKGSGDFVHFVSSENPTPPDGGPDQYGPNSPNFDRLEASLRHFILEKRSLSKLAPAKTFLVNTLADVVLLANANISRASEKLEATEQKINDLLPSLNEAIKEGSRISENIDRDIERLSHTVFSQTNDYLSSVVDSVGTAPVVEYKGIQDIFNYAISTREVIVAQIQEAVAISEDHARGVTASAVDAIKSIGILHAGEQPAFLKVFQKSAMFTRSRDNLSRTIKAELGISDFLDLSSLVERPLPILRASKSALLASSATTLSSTLTLFSVIGGGQLALGTPAIRALINSSEWFSWLRVKRLLVPILAIGVSGLVLLSISELPRTIPRRLARKIALEVDELGYVRSNSDRIATECRKVLRFPAEDVRAALQTEVENKVREQDRLRAEAADARNATVFFETLKKKARSELQEVESLSFELDLSPD